MPRAGLDAEAVVGSAAAIADRDGLSQLTLAKLAHQLGVRPPSLYAHIEGLRDLRGRIAARGARELATVLDRAAAGVAGAQALHAIAHAYRAYALRHPGVYSALQQPQAGDEAFAAPVAVVVAALGGYGLEGDEALHGVRVVRAALHGFVMLELNGGFGLPLDLDDSFARLVSTLDRGLRGFS